MGSIDTEKDLERGDFDNSKVSGDEKRVGGEFNSAQSSPTLTQDTFESNGDAKGMQQTLVFEVS
jgi:hypothetical protein